MPTPSRGRRTGIAVKLGAVMAALTVIFAVVAGVLFVQLREVATTYDRILNSEVRSALQVREMQVALKTQVQEWKNIILRGSDPADLAQYTKQFRDESARVDRVGNDALASTTDDSVRADVTQFLADHATINRTYEAALAPFVAGGGKDFATADRAARGLDRPLTAHIDGTVARLDTAIADRTAAQRARVASQQRVLAVVGLVALLFLLATLAFVVAGIVRPLRALTRAAYRAANEDLPDAIGRIRREPGDAPPELPAVQVRSRDELRDLADALSSMQGSAVALAFDQHRAEREGAEMLVNLGRRNQSLLKRTLGYISELEADESDPDVLARLFRLDHATTRIRRNAESMLVLAGAEQTRTWSRPVPVDEVVRAALSEIEDYARVDLHHLEDAALTGTAIADLVHLVAELAENATHFSPPHSRVSVVGQRVADGYRLRLIDQGVGMTAAELHAANDRIAQAADARTDSPLLGLYVVGRLAARHGIAVALEPSAGVGITATITIPAALLVDPTPSSGLPQAVPDAATPDPVRPDPVNPDMVTARHRVPAPRPRPDVAPQVAREPVVAPRVPEPREPEREPAMALVGAGAAAALPVPPMPEPRGRSWTVPPDAASAEPGTVTGWFHALADPPPDRTNGAEPPPDVEPADTPDAAEPAAIPRRVRGAQLPDLGDARSGQEFAAPDPEQVRRQLSALHGGVERAQAEQARRS